MSLTPERILAQLELFRDHEYGREPDYPTPLPGVRLRKYSHDTPQIDCCSFVEGLLVPASGIQWSRAQHRRSMIRRNWITKRIREPFSPVNMMREAGLAKGASPIIPPRPWSVVQLWRHMLPWSGGHTLIVVEHDKYTDKILTLEANKSQTMKLNGVGARGIGHYRDHGLRPDRWQDMPCVPTWERLCETYPYRAVGQLILGQA